MGLLVIFIIAKAIELYVQISNGVESAWIQVLKLFGFQTPTNAPTFLVNLITTGYSGIKYWDIIKGLMILIVLYEWSENKDRLNSAGHGAFGMITLFLVLITVPSFAQKLKELNILKSVVK